MFLRFPQLSDNLSNMNHALSIEILLKYLTVRLRGLAIKSCPAYQLLVADKYLGKLYEFNEVNRLQRLVGSSKWPLSAYSALVCGIAVISSTNGALLNSIVARERGRIIFAWRSTPHNNRRHNFTVNFL